MTTTDAVRPSEADIKVLLDAGCHFGHQTKRWNPKMKPYIFGVRNGIHIIDLDKTWDGLQTAKTFLRDLVMGGRQVLFVGTKKQAQEIVKRVAESAKQPYVINRWLGGMLTNNRTIRQSVARMRKIEDMERTGAFDSMPKKEVSTLRHELAKLQKNLGGVKDMHSLPAAVFVVDVCRESLAVDEAAKLNIPVVAMVDTNADNVEKINKIIPANDDAIRSIEAILSMIGKEIQDAAGEFQRNCDNEAQQRAIKDAEIKREQENAEIQRKARDRDASKARAAAIAKARAAAAAKAETKAEAKPEAAVPEAPATDAAPATEG